ncbi:MAG: M10 family metallopeptidase C-terminal domain-containing protein, partial [Phenylobacterium sp.]|nr:M10 family metallopeptidase C-terminal domain-containing protein [Phenylobacterium sp.]
AHPSDYDASDVTSPTYANSAGYAEDSRQYTVMSYFSETNTGGAFGGTYSAAPMLDDIAAAQLEYGPNTTTRLTDTTYGFNANAGRPWFEAATSTAKLVFAVWDAGGVDTFDFSGFSQNQIIDLRPGFFSSVGGLSGNVAVAIGAVIENAIGGSGSDQIYGNSATNRLSGGPGDDVLDGGEGVDTAIFSAAQANYRWTTDASGWRVTDLRTGVPEGVDTLRSIEFLKFSDTTVRLVSAALVLEPSVSAAITNLLRVSVGDSRVQNLTNELAQRVGEGSLTDTAAIASIVKAAGATTSVATMSYEFFTGKIPTQLGIDYLISPAGPNINNLNSAYYQNFNLENRYINFAVNLGKFGEGRDAFAAAYGALNLFDATRQAYATIFGAAPTDAKLHALLEPSLVLNNVTMTRADYFAIYGQDGADGLGAKAAMVGWPLAEGQKADVGIYARANDAFLQDLADGAAFAVDLIGVYGKPDYIYNG